MGTFINVCVCRWRRQETEESAIERVQLKSSPAHSKEAEKEEEEREHEHSFTQTNAGDNHLTYMCLLFQKV